MIFVLFRQKSRQNWVLSNYITGLHPALKYCAHFGAFFEILKAHFKTFAGIYYEHK